MDKYDRLKQWAEMTGTDRFRRLGAILGAVAQAGSLNRATAALGVSYRQAWGLIKRVEEELGEPVLASQKGGTAGGGTALTPLGHDLLERYRRLQSEVSQILTTPPADPARPVLIATTIGPVETGVMGALEAGFYQATGIWVRHIAAGTGQALDLARAGRVDLVLTHAPAEEERFVAEGWGLARTPLMTNHFILVGPAGDPAVVHGAASAAEAVLRIAEAKAPFLSRGDRSGTHLKEEALWAAAGVVPGPPWHQVYALGAQGSRLTLLEAGRLGAYTLVDRATWATVSPSGLAVLLEGDPALANPFSLIALHPERFPQLNHAGADQFIRWATGPAGQAMIAETGMFTPPA